MLPQWVIDVLKQGDLASDHDASEASICIAEHVAEMEYEEPGSSEQLYDWLWEKHDIEY